MGFICSKQAAVAALEQYAVGATEAAELHTAVEEAADETNVGTVEQLAADAAEAEAAEAAEAEERRLAEEEEAARAKAEAAEAAALAELNDAGTLNEVLPDADPNELRWPVADIFIADAMGEYLEVLEEVRRPFVS